MFKSTKTNLIIRGILFTVLGILCFCNPGFTVQTVAFVIGLAIIIAGAVFFVLGLKGYGTSTDTMRLSVALLLIPVGLLVMFKPDFIIIVLGIFVLFEGIDFTLSSLKYKKAGSQGWWLMLIMGLAVIVLSAVAIFYPGITQALIGILIGCAFIGIGCASFTALAGINLVEDYFEAAHKALLEKDEHYEEAEIVK